jgi:hypothetical protein
LSAPAHFSGSSPGGKLFRPASGAAACLFVTAVLADPQDIDLRTQCNRPNEDYVQTLQIGASPGALNIRLLNGNGSRIYWSFSSIPVTDGAGQSCIEQGPVSRARYACQGLTISLPDGAPDQPVPDSAVTRIEGTPNAPGTITFRPVVVPDGSIDTCERAYRLTIATPKTPSAPTTVIVQ